MRKNAALFFAAVFLFVLAALYFRTADEIPEAPDREALFSLPYVGWHPVNDQDRHERGVVLSIPGKTAPGINIYSSYTQPVVAAIDNAGNLLHEWVHKSDLISSQIPLPDGRLLGMEYHQSVFMLDRDSRLLWSRKGRFHHDLERTPDGRIYALETRRRHVMIEGRRVHIADDFLVLLSPEGEELSALSIFDLLRPHITLEEVNHAIEKGVERGTHVRPETPLEERLVDLLHTNTLYRLDQSLGHFGIPGDLLICVRNQDKLLLIRPEEKRILWSWGPGILSWPHQPRLTHDNRILFFDNYGHRGFSRVGIVNPLDNQVEWVYAPEDASTFFTGTNGFAQQLPNGNFLISESSRGHIFEITSQGETVWEFWNPELSEDSRLRAGIERMVRLPEDYFKPPLISAKKSQAEHTGRNEGNTESA